jgi:PAS domain S-box-containing protein
MSDPSPLSEYRREVERLIQRLSEADEALQALGAGELDAVVDPASAAPILLSRAQEAISKSEARYRDLISRCPVLVCEISPTGETLFVNDAARLVLGYEPDELTDAYLWDTLVPPEHADEARRLEMTLRRRDVTGFELPLRRKSGDLRWLLWNTANRYSDDGTLDMIVAFALDITERRNAEERSRELADAQVARAKAEAANKAKTDFLAVMSHELRTPLNSIGGYAELIEMGLRGPVTTEQVQDLQRIRRSQRHLLGLINDLMNFAKLETGHVELEFGNVPVNETLAVLDALTEPQVASKGITYTQGRCDPLLTAWADREKVHQILINLVSNAVKFTQPGGSITVECDDDEHRVRVHVSDTGQGIPADKLAAVFEPFVQVKTGFTRPHEGVGLGLAISRDLARLMGGDLTAQSTVGKGSRFTLTLLRHRPANFDPPRT